MIEGHNTREVSGKHSDSFLSANEQPAERLLRLVGVGDPNLLKIVILIEDV